MLTFLQRVLLLYRHDISASHADELVKAVMERCVSENYVDKHITNLKVGEVDSYVYLGYFVFSPLKNYSDA